MNITRTRAVTAALLLFAAGAGVLAYIKYQRFSAYLTAQISGQAAKKLGREVKFKSVSFSPLTGIVIKEACISRPPDFSKGNFFCAKKTVIRPQLAAMLRNQVYFSRVAFNGASLKVREKGGKWDFEDLLARLPERTKGLYLTWNASELQFTDSALEADLETSGLSLALQGADIKLEHYSTLGGNYGLTAGGTLKSAVKGKLFSAEVALDADANFDYGGMSSTKGTLAASKLSYGEISLDGFKADWALFNMRKPLAEKNYSASFSAQNLLVPANGNQVRDGVAKGLDLFSAAMGRSAPRIGDIEASSLSAAFLLNDSALAVKDIALRTNFMDLDARLAIAGHVKTADASLKASIGSSKLEMSASGPMNAPEIKPLLSSTLSSKFKTALNGLEEDLLKLFPVTGAN
ncbi:MAG: hypothetical protein HY952_07780 [Elusimicrobia bacterium]|nr:hypothetical protein [Elusimicrobiota bacterium]